MLSVVGNAGKMGKSNTGGDRRWEKTRAGLNGSRLTDVRVVVE